MRRTLVAVAVAVLGFGLLACQPAVKPTISATPSTLHPACREITTVTGKTAPVGALANVVLEYQRGTAWQAWSWYSTGAPGEGVHEIRARVASNGTYVLKYVQPGTSTPAIRLRVRGMKKLSDPGVVSASWKVTRQPGACS